jgi:hypothetical protein
VSSSLFYRVKRGVGRPDGEGDREAGGGGINVGRLVRWGGEMEGCMGSEEGGKVQCHFQERRGHQGGGSARGRWRWCRPVGLPKEEDSRPTDRVGLPISEGEAVGQAGPEGGGREVGHGWARNRKWLDKIFSNFIWNLDFWQTLEICTRRFRRNFDMGILPKIF